jgi:acyl carrier protein
VRGYRIELGEIEAALEQHPSVARAAVVVGHRSASEPQIVAYLVASASSPMDHGLLRSFVAESLPHYMVPSSFITLETLPLTPSGKLDRLALPEPPSVVSRADGLSYNPDRPSQTAIAEVWAEVLGLDHVALDDNFFNLGGHSLLATQAASRLRKWFDVELPLRKLFEAPTVRELAEVIDSELSQKLQQKWAKIRSRDRKEPVALSYAQQRLWFLDQLEPGSDSYNIAAALRMEGRLDEEALGRALQEVVRRHEALRTRIEVIGTEPYQVLAEQVELRLPVIDHSELAEPSQAAAGERVKRQEASAGFNLSTGPVIRAKLIRQGAEDHLLLVTMHHIVSDGWSMGVLVKEVSALYEAYCRGEESPLAELPVQYADYALWQREWLQGEVLEEQLRYWEEKLAGAPALIDLPTDRARAASRAGGGRAGQVRVEFDEELTRSIKQESRKQALTLYMLLMGAVGVLLTRYSRNQEVVLGSPIANRLVAEVEGLIGFFVNTLALRVRVEEEETVEELLKRVREEVLGAYAHQDVPYEKVVERVQVERAGEAGGLFQVMLAVQNAPTYVLDLHDLTLTSEETYNRKAKFDLLFLFYEEGSQIKGSVTYNSDLFDDDTINLMVGRFMNLLKSAVSNMQQPVSSLSMLGEEEIGGVTVADFPEIGLDQQDLENLILELSEQAT